jgi:TonB family protein
MRRYILWVLLLFATACAVVIWLRFAAAQLTPSELKIGNAPPLPQQEGPATIECSHGLDIDLRNANGDWSVIQDHPPCTVRGIFLSTVKATADEMEKLSCRPLFSFQVATTGLTRNVKLLRSSGSTTLDERALQQVIGYRYPPHNCGICKMSVPINVDFHGPVWTRDPPLRRVSKH